MTNIIKIQLVLFFSFALLSADYPDYTDYDISLYFEVTESAINQFLKTQIFPQPEGTIEDGGNQYDYKVTLIQPGIEISAGEIIFTSEIIGKVTVLGTTVRYSYPIEVPVSIPAGSISVNGISGLLQDIPDVINNVTSGPQWLKDIIIEAYEELELIIYPDQFMDTLNAQIPDDIDININDVAFSWEALYGKLQFHITVPCQSREPFVVLVNLWSESDTQVRMQFRSNVFLRILNIEMFSLMSGQVANGSTTTTIPAPESGQDVGAVATLTLGANSGKKFASGSYTIRVIFGNDFGWFKKTYSYNIVD